MKYIKDDTIYSPSSYNHSYSEDLIYETSNENRQLKNNSDYDV